MCSLHYERWYRSGDPLRGRVYFDPEQYLGRKYNMLRVVSYVGTSAPLGTKGLKRLFIFKCDCGKYKTITISNVKNSHTRSCGCIFKKAVSKANSTHGAAGRKYDRTYMGMRDRCYNPHNPSYPRYGGRGIKVCDRWLESYDNFENDVGERPEGTTLDRVDNDGDYTPENCRWATRVQQGNNTRRSYIYSVDGNIMNMINAQKVTGLKKSTIKWRHYNWGKVR